MSADNLPPGIPPEEPLPEPIVPRSRWTGWLRHLLIGRRREFREPGIFHKVSLIALLAWVGLGADGLSSSAYGPEEAFKALGEHTYLAIALALATAFTVGIISYAYSRIIEYFPYGGGGYVVASSVLGPKVGLVSGAALLIDYVLTIAISIAAGADAIFSFLPVHWQDMHILGLMPLKLFVEFSGIALLVLLNLRGVRESVTLLTPIFITFLLTHAILIFGVLFSRIGEVPVVVGEISQGFSQGLQDPPIGLGLMGMIALFLRAYSMGGGTYTGIEAVSNGLMIMREPRVETGKKTMLLIAVSLAITASGLIVAYLLAHVFPVEGKTMNAVLVERFASQFAAWGTLVTGGFVMITLISEAALLFVAAQAGVIAGPRVMANMAHDSWMPHRFSQLSDRLTMHNGIMLIGLAAVFALIYTKGEVSHLVIMYSINVFLTFSITELAMCRFFSRDRAKYPNWKREILPHIVGLVLCLGILIVTTYEKFGEGGWVTIVVTGVVVIVCFLIRRHYRRVSSKVEELNRILTTISSTSLREAPPLDRTKPTAVMLVGSYSGLGVHSLFSIQRQFPGHFHNFIFLSVGVIDSANFKGADAVEQIQEYTEKNLKDYVALANSFGLAADYRMAIGTETVETAVDLCTATAKEYPKSLFIAGKLLFEEEHWYQRLLHNETAYQLQRRLQFAGLNAMVLPIRVTGRV